MNIANLTSAQAVARSGELSLRLALGASTRDVLRVHLAELLIVCIAGLIPGLLLARAAVPALLAINPTIAQTLGTVDHRLARPGVQRARCDSHGGRCLGRTGDTCPARPDVVGAGRHRNQDDGVATGRAGATRSRVD